LESKDLKETRVRLDVLAQLDLQEQEDLLVQLDLLDPLA